MPSRLSFRFGTLRARSASLVTVSHLACDIRDTSLSARTRQVQDQTVDLAGGTFLTSGTFWGGAGAVIGLISIIAIVWVTIHVARPKRRLLVSITGVPLLAPRANLAGRLTITFDRDTVQAPYVATITLRSRGRHLDIPRSAFDGDKPMELVTTAEIIGIVDVTTDRGRTKPAVTSATKSHRLMIEPCLIKWD